MPDAPTTVLLAALGAAVGALAWALSRVARDVSQLRSETMGKFEDVQQVLDAVDAETDRIAAEFEALKGEIAGGGLNTEQEAAVLARLDGLASRLRAIGKDPENPVPEPEPTPEPGEPTV